MRSLLTASIQANENVICTSSKNLPDAGHRFNYLIVKF